jgi:hypothetical protein
MARQSRTRFEKKKIERQLAARRYDRGNPKGLVTWEDLEVYVQDQLTGLEQHLDRKHGPGSTIRWVLWHLGQAGLAILGIFPILRDNWRMWRRNRRVAREHKARANIP